MKIKSITPFLACKDIAQTLAFYTDVIGFEKDWAWGEPITDAGVRSGSFSLYLTLNPEVVARIVASEVSICVEDVEQLFKTHEANGTPIISGLEAKPWGTTEYSVRDPNGYILRFGA